MHRFARFSVAALILTALLVSSTTAQPYYQSREDYLNRIPAVTQLDRVPQSKLTSGLQASSAAGEPDIDAVWTGATVWMSGINWGGSVFGGSIDKGKYFFGSNVTDGDYVSIRIIFNTGTTTSCGTFRRDLGYDWGGVGTFPGTAWDISDPGTPRRLNMCFVEDNNASPADLAWNPDGNSGGGYPGKREYIYVMNSDYDGDGLTYDGANGYTGAVSLDILYNWWPLVASGHSFFENQPCTLTINAYYVANFYGVPDEDEVILSWNYTGDETIDHFNIYGDDFSPPTTLLGQVSGSESRYTAGGLTTGTPYYFRVEADNAARSIVGQSKEISLTPAIVSSGITLLDFWNQRGTYGDCWGYVDTATGKEYALICARNEGASIIDINVSPPVEVGFLPAIVAGNDAKDIKIYKNYAILISENEPGQIFDITDVTNPVQVSTIVSEGGGGGAHNCMVDGDYLYVVGNHSVGGLEIFDISNPASPSNVGDFEPFYYHDLDIYNDTIAAAGIYGDGIDLIDVTNKAAPAFVQTFNYASSGAHNCEFIQGMDYVAVGDEIGGQPHTRIFDLQNLGSINKVADILITPGQATHNCYVRNDTLFIAHYALGLRLYDVSDPTSPVDVGYYDTYAPPTVGYVGAWNVYPYFPSGKIIVSDMQTGLYVMEIEGTMQSCCIGGRGDCNDDGTDANILDLNFLVNRVFRGGPLPVCEEEGDCNGDAASSNILDLNFLVNRVFRGGPAPGPCS